MEVKEEVKVAVLEEQIKNVVKSVDSLSGKIDSLTDKIDNAYVKKEDFNPVRKTVDDLKYWQAKVVGYATAVAIVIEFVFKWVTKTN
jgi:tetrahydromethanopterin S-methyltransferase subunit G